MITVDITDKNGVKCPYANNMVQFKVSGPAKIIGVDNGDPIDLSEYKTNKRRAFRGKIMLLLQATDEKGMIEVTASSQGLENSKMRILSK
jgi:beta-galactosidase